MWRTGSGFWPPRNKWSGYKGLSGIISFLSVSLLNDIENGERKNLLEKIFLKHLSPLFMPTCDNVLTAVL